MKLVLILIIMALSILSSNVNGLRDSAERAGDINDTDISSRSKNKSATEAVDHAASDAMQPSCDSINGNDTASSDTVSVTGVEKDPADISSINKNIDNSVNDSNDNNASVIVVDFGLVPPSGVSNVAYDTKGIVSNVGCDVGAGHVVSGEAVVAGDSPSVLPPPASSEVEMVDASAVRKQSRPSGSSDGDSCGSGSSLKKGTIKGVRKSGATGSSSLAVSRQVARSMAPTVGSVPTRLRQP